MKEELPVTAPSAKIDWCAIDYLGIKADIDDEIHSWDVTRTVPRHVPPPCWQKTGECKVLL